MKSQINLRKEIGIDFLGIRRTANGGVFSITGQDSLRHADLLAERMIKVLGKYERKIKVIRPQKIKMDVIISGKGDFVTCDEVVSAVATAGTCNTENICAGKIMYRSFGRWSIRVACPASVSNRICKLGSLQLGWGRASVKRAPPHS